MVFVRIVSEPSALIISPNMYFASLRQGLEKSGFARTVLADEECDRRIEDKLRRFPKDGEIEWIAIR
jgi:hypothetical protein